MNRIRDKSDIDTLFRELNSLVSFAGSAKREFVKGIQALIQDMDKGFALESSGRSSHSYGKPSLAYLLQTNLNPLIEQELANNRMWQWWSPSSLPFRKGMGFEDIRSTSEELSEISQKLDTAIDGRMPWSFDLHRETAATFQLLADTLYILSVSTVEKPSIKFCDLCFRRAGTTKYCSVHSSTNDSSYRRGRAIRKLILRSEQDLEAYELYKVIRKSLKAITSPRNRHAIYNAPDEERLLYQALTNWNDAVRTAWDEYLSQNCLYLYELLSLKPKVSPDWGSFVASLKKDISDTFEDISHPYWIRYQVRMADVWLCCENYHKKKARKAEVLELLNTKSVQEVINETGLSRSYIYNLKSLIV